MIYFLKLNKKNGFFISKFKKKMEKEEVACITYAITIKAYQIKYYVVRISYLYLNNLINLTKKIIFFKAKFNKKEKKKTRENPSNF